MVPDLTEALTKRGVDVSDIQILGERPSHSSHPLDNVDFIFFSDPDGNGMGGTAEFEPQAPRARQSSYTRLRW